MKTSDILTPGIPSFFLLDCVTADSASLTNRDVLTYLEHLMITSSTKLTRNEAALNIAKHIETLKISNGRDRKALLWYAIFVQTYTL